MNTSSQLHARISSVGAMLAPLLAVGLIRFAGPQQSVAATAQPVFEAPSLPSMHPLIERPSGVVATAAAYAHRLYESGFSGAPFPTAEPRTDASDTPPNPELAPTPIGDSGGEAPEIRVSAIMARRGGAIAVIDARIRSVGSTVAPGWTLDEIDEPNRTLVIRHRSGRRVQLSLSTP